MSKYTFKQFQEVFMRLRLLEAKVATLEGLAKAP